MPEIKLDIRTATLIVAASDSLHRNMADYVCDQIADDIEINQALNALPAEGGRVILLEGQYLLAAPIIIPDHDICLEGQSWATFINGNNLLTGNHAIQLTSKSNCHLKNFSIRTQAGGGKTCHCIFVEDGCYDLRIDNIYFEDSDSDAIHIEGTSMNRVQIFNCFIEGADDHGIHITPDALDQSASFQIYNNHIQSCGIDGIHFTTCANHNYHIIAENHIECCANSGIVAADVLREASIVDNYIRFNTFNGMRFEDNCDNNLIENNYCNSNGAYGIVIAAASCYDNKLKNNKLIGNTLGAVVDMGTLTHLPWIFVPVPEPGTVIGTHPATLLTDGLAVTDRIEVYIPIEFQELVRAQAVLVPGGTGNLRRSVATNWGMIGSGEIYNSDAGAIAAGEVAVNLNHLEYIDISAAFTGVAPVNQGDAVGIEFTRHGNHANDTVNADCYLLGVRIQYV
jgi:parallel beta-helix repeat protein